VVGFSASSGTGKTTLLTRILPLIRQRGLRVAVIKHAHHQFDPDTPGKDSYRIREAGASQTIVASRQRMVLFRDFASVEAEPRLQTLLDTLDPAEADLVLVEGFKHETFAKIELHRPSLGRTLRCTEDPHIIAVASDAEIELPRDLPLLDLNDPAAIVDFLLSDAARP
jgi:molybdopterin-guanine dinucleotide biosynthesis protein MobB